MGEIIHTIALKKNNMSPTEKLVYMAILSHRNSNTGQCNPGTNRLMEATGLSASAIKNAKESLAAKGYLYYTSERGNSGSNQSCNYYICSYLDEREIARRKVEWEKFRMTTKAIQLTHKATQHNGGRRKKDADTKKAPSAYPAKDSADDTIEVTTNISVQIDNTSQTDEYQEKINTLKAGAGNLLEQSQRAAVSTLCEDIVEIYRGSEVKKEGKVIPHDIILERIKELEMNDLIYVAEKLCTARQNSGAPYRRTLLMSAHADRIASGWKKEDEPNRNIQFNNFHQRKYDEDELERMLLNKNN